MLVRCSRRPEPAPVCCRAPATAIIRLAPGMRHPPQRANMRLAFCTPCPTLRQPSQHIETGMRAALSANSLIFCAKLAAWLASGGSALLAEAIHSLADVGNQAMMRVGVMKAAKAPDASHPFGHMRDKFIFR